MKSKCSFILKATTALVLAVVMLFGTVATTLAAVVDNADTGAEADLAASGWNNTTWYLGNDIAKVWDNSASNCTMTKSGTVKFYYDLYLKTTDADVYYRPYEKDNYAMGPTAGNNTKVTTTGTAGSGYNDNRCWYFDTADCTANKYNKIRIWIDTSGNNGNGWSWYEKTEISNISPTLTVPSTGTVGTAITLTGGSTDANKIGTLTKTYQYSTNNGSTWTDLASGSYTATSEGTVKFRYKVSDAGVKTSGSGTNGRTARVEYSSEQSCTFSNPTTPSIDTFTIGSSSSKTLNIGETATLASTTSNTSNSVTYSTTSDAISISGTTVTALKPVTSATITATLVDGSTYTKTVTCKVNTPTVAFANTSAVTLNIGATTTRAASSKSTVGSAITSDKVAYSSSATGVATVNSSGVITGVAAGTANISATRTIVCGGQTTTCTTSTKVAVTVNAPTISVADDTSHYVGDTYTPSPTLTNPSSTSSDWTVSYAVKSGTTATTDGSTITFVGYGSYTTITASYKYKGTVKATDDFQVAPKVPTISAFSYSNINIDATGTPTVTASNVNNMTASYAIKSGDSVTVNSTTGVVTGVKPGTTTITVTYDWNGCQVTKDATVTVNTPSITQGNVTIAKGDSKTLSTATTNPSSGLTVTFAVSGSPNGVTCTSAGVVTVAQDSTASTATVVATAMKGNTTVATKNITVTIAAPSLTVMDGSTSVVDGTVYTTKDTNKTLTVGTNFSDSLTVKSSNTNIATVSLSGTTLTITPKAKGTCKVSVSTDSGYAPTAANLAATAAAMPEGSLIRKIVDLAVTAAVATQTAQFTVNVAEADTYKYVYFTNGVGFTTPKIYLFGGSDTNAAFPGVSMVKIGKNEENKDVYAIRYLATKDYTKAIICNSADNSKRVQLSGSSDLTLSSTQNAFWCNTANSDSGAGRWNCTIQKPQITANNVTIDMGGTETMTATVLTSGTPSTFNWSSGTTSVATTADTHTASNVITGVAPGTSTITIKAYAEKPSGWNSIVTDGTADDYVAGTTTATATVVAENKTVTFGAKKTDDGDAFSDLSDAVTAKYYDEDTSSGTGTSGSTSSGSGAGFYMWYNTNNSKDLNAATSAGEMVDLGDGTCYGSFTCAAGQNYDVVINDSSTKGSCLTSSTTVTGNQTWAKVENNGDTYWALDSYSAAVTIYVIYNNTSNSVTFTTTNPASSGSGSSGSGSSGTTGEGTTMTSPASVPYGKVAVFTAEATKTVSDVTYTFVEWVDDSGNKLSSDNPYSVKVTENKTVYARYFKTYKLSAFDSYELNGTTVSFVTAPPKLITVKHGEDIYLYSYDGTKAGGNPDSPDGTNPAALPIESGSYGQGNYIQYYAGDEITLYYSAMASSEIFKGVFYNNSVSFYVNTPTYNQFQGHDYTAEHTLYMNSAYYDVTVPSGLPSTTIDPDNHSIKFIGTQDYKNIDVELATKRKVYFSDYTNAIIGSKNVDDYYSDGEALSETGDQLTVKAAGSATQTNSINKDNVKFYRADANGQPTGSALSGFTVAYDSGTDPVTNSGADASTRYIIISGNMPAYDLYIDLGMTNSYTIKLGSKIMSDPFASKTRLAEVADVTIKEGNTTKLTAPNNADVTASSTDVATGTALSLSSAFTDSWGDYYMFVGWYWGTDTAPDFEKGFISDKISLSYTPKKGGTIWAVATRGLYINGSKYITGKDTDWYGENNEQKNLLMSFDAESGRYYWEITDTMFAAAGSNYKTWKVDSWTEKHTDYGVYAYSDAYYWTDNDDKYHGKSFFQILDTESGSSDKTVWDSITSFKEDTPANGPTYGKIYPRDYSDDYYKKHDGQGFINFNETDYAGQSSPLRIYFNPSATGNARLTVESTKIYSNLYVSNGYTVGSTLKTSAVTVEPVVDGVVKTSGQTGYFSVGKQGDGWDPDVEGHVNHYKPQKKGATVRITKTAGGSDKIVAFFIYDITNKTVRAERDVKNSGSNYYIDLTLANEEQNLYIVPIIEEAGANVTISFDATQLNRKQWGDIVTAYAWYQNNGGAALGDYPGQPMIPSDDMTTWTTTFKGVKNNNELEGITFSNYVDGAHSWLGCNGVMGTVTYGGAGTQASPTTVSIADGAIIKQYNYIESGNNKEYSRANFKAQTYDYREPIALYDRFKDQDHVSISFSMKDGNSSLISWRHTDLTSHNIVTLEPDPDWGKLNWEYLTNAKGDKYIDMNGNTMKTKPTASFYVAAKGLVLYNNSSMTNVFYSGKSYDAVSGVTYGGHSGVSMNYAVQWYVYDASGNYITNVLTAGIADLSTNGVDTYIGKVLEDKGYAVDGKSVAICYDKPRYMYGDAASGSGATGYNGKVINVGDNFDAYRFTGQWNAVASNELVTVKVGVGMMTDSGEVLAPSNTAGYGNASAAYDTTKGNNTHVTDEDANDAPFTASDGSFVRTAVRDAENSPVKLSASAQNFIGWYYYDANTGDFVKANYADNENFYPNYSNKDVTFYAMYRASAVYQYKYIGREGQRTYSASGNDLTADEMNNSSIIDAASHEADIKTKLPVGIGIFKKNIDFTPTNYATWTKTPDQNGYVLDIAGFAVTIPEYTLTAYYKGSSGEDKIITETAVYNGTAVDLTVLNNGSAVTAEYGSKFLGWYAYDNGVRGDLLSTQANYGLRLTRDQAIIAVYDENGSTTRAEDSQSWKVFIDENEVNKELTTSSSGVFYNDTIVRVRNGSDVKATLPTNAKIGVIVISDNKIENAKLTGYNDTQLQTLVTSIASGKTMKAKSGISITNMQASAQTNFNRTDIAVRSDFAKNNGTHYSVYAYFYDGDNYIFSEVSGVKTYE